MQISCLQSLFELIYNFVLEGLKKKMFKGVIQNYVEYLTEFDHPKTIDFIDTEYMNWASRLGLFADIKSTRMCQAKVVTTLAINFFLNAFHSYISVVTAIQAMGWSVPYACIMISNAVIYVGVFFFTLMSFSARREMSQIHAAISNNFYEYHLEMDSQGYNYYNMVNKSFRKTMFLIPVMITTGIIVMIIWKPILPDDSLSTLEVEFIFIIWYPISINTWPIYLIATALQIAVLYQAYAIVTFNMYVFLTVSLHWLMQINRLIDSIKGTEDRAICYYKDKYQIAEVLHGEMFLLYRNNMFVDCYIACIKENVDHHQILIRYAFYFRLWN